MKGIKMKKQHFAVFLFSASAILSASPATEAANKAVTEQKLVNLCKNGTFENVSSNRREAGYWSFWKNKDSQCKVSFEKNVGENGSTGAVLSGGKGTIFTKIKAQPGEKFYIRANFKKAGEGTAGIAVRFFDAEGEWLSGVSLSKSVEFSKDAEWSKCELIVKIPEKAKAIVPMISARDLAEPASQIIIDNVEVYRLPVTAK